MTKRVGIEGGGTLCVCLFVPDGMALTSKAVSSLGSQTKSLMRAWSHFVLSPADLIPRNKECFVSRAAKRHSTALQFTTTKNGGDGPPRQQQQYAAWGWRAGKQERTGGVNCLG